MSLLLSQTPDRLLPLLSFPARESKLWNWPIWAHFWARIQKFSVLSSLGPAQIRFFYLWKNGSRLIKPDFWYFKKVQFRHSIPSKRDHREMDNGLLWEALFPSSRLDGSLRCSMDMAPRRKLAPGLSILLTGRRRRLPPPLPRWRRRRRRRASRLGGWGAQCATPTTKDTSSSRAGDWSTSLLLSFSSIASLSPIVRPSPSFASLHFLLLLLLLLFFFPIFSQSCYLAHEAYLPTPNTNDRREISEG